MEKQNPENISLPQYLIPLLVALILFSLIAIVLSAFSLMRSSDQNQQIDSPMIAEVSDSTVKEKDGANQRNNIDSLGGNFKTHDCGVKNCLFTDTNGITAGYATVKGYYSQFDVFEPRENAYFTCDAFVITEGPQEFNDNPFYLTDNIPQFSFYLDYLSDSEKQSVISSTKENPISVNIISEFHPIGQGAGACYSSRQIVNVAE